MTDQDYMRRAKELAKLARGWTNPNPMVGAVIVKDGEIVGEGYHRRCGELHAERNAFASLKKSSDAEGATIYVTLEPCVMCAGALGWSQISRIVYGAEDPRRGFSRIAPDALHPRTKVESGLLADECLAFVTEFFKKKR